MVESDFARFDGVIGSETELAELIGTPPPKVVDKVIDRLDDICRAFIARSPFCIIATATPGTHIDVSPRGDPAGFVTVLDDRHVAIPDRPGNRRVDTFRNILADPHVGLIFLVPGKGETLRLRGEGRIVRDQALRRSMAVDGKVPALALVVRVDEAFVHCPKAFIRSGLWDTNTWPQTDTLPDIGRAMIRHAGLDQSPDDLFAEATAEGLTTLY
ncbi:pyridoxamine 5'-phosphate oxidase family protein [Acuticoccus sediminis]|uniref:pyridoxamine 5'-phosphate oxidase family protein n=1 Tax=Acuticoccus sediminis TaxID=2184697 RepID=UPI001CFF53CE|nr:pyridoxamine 5'-phosphate oxidase family protein [Acuticoccus sediminis]